MSAILHEIQESPKKLDEKFVQFRDKVKRGQEDAAEKALKRVRREKPSTSRREVKNRRCSTRKSKIPSSQRLSPHGYHVSIW